MRSLPWGHLERAAVLVLLLVALVPRVRDLGRGFDRGFEGYQGAFFAIAAVNYERLGAATTHGYPVLNLDLPQDSIELPGERPSAWFLYPNHPPGVPLLAWTSARLLGPEGWSEAWREGDAPTGLEPALRLPFLALHLLGLWLLWWVAREAFGPQVGLLTLGLSVYLPVSALYGTLVNYEVPAVPLVLLAVGLYVRYVRAGRTRDLAGLGLAFGLGTAVTFAPLFFLPPLVLRSAWRRRWGEATRVAMVGGAGALVALALHRWQAGAALEVVGREPEFALARARVLLEPLLRGEVPASRWLELQLLHGGAALGWGLWLACLVGVLLSFSRALSRKADDRLRAGELPRHARRDVDVGLPLLAGGLLYLFAFYRHTAEEQWTFWLLVAPGALLMAARALHATSALAWRLRAGFAPLAVLTLSVALPGLARFETWRAAVRQEAPQPRELGHALHALLPPGAVGVHPPELGLNLAATYYAWRSLAPASDPRDPTLEALLERLALDQAPRFLILPDTPPPAAATAIESLRPPSAPSRSAEGWSAWKTP